MRLNRLLLLGGIFPACYALATPDYSILSRRIGSQQSSEAEVRCLLLDSMVSRQRLTLQFAPPVSEYVKEARESGTPIAVLGMNQREGRVLRKGVEARIESMSPYRASHGYFSSHSTMASRGFTAFDTTLVGGRRFEILELVAEPAGSKWHKPPPPPVWPPDTPSFLARVRWLDDDATPTPAAMVLAETVCPLIATWCSLVRDTERERAPGQVDQILSDVRAAFARGLNA